MICIGFSEIPFYFAQRVDLRELLMSAALRLEAGERPRFGATGAEDTAATVTDLAARFDGRDLFQRLAAIQAHIAGRIVFPTSFGLEDQAIAHAILSQGLAIDIVTLDTGRLFPETHEVWAETERRYGARIAAFVPLANSVDALTARQGQ